MFNISLCEGLLTIVIAFVVLGPKDSIHMLKFLKSLTLNWKKLCKQYYNYLFEEVDKDWKI